jgi:hypothetical protein
MMRLMHDNTKSRSRTDDGYFTIILNPHKAA